MHYLIQAIGAHMGQERLCSRMTQDVILWHPEPHLQAASLHPLTPGDQRCPCGRLRLLLDKIGKRLKSVYTRAMTGQALALMLGDRLRAARPPARSISCALSFHTTLCGRRARAPAMALISL